jgi:polysaccharide deacetylase 2 family uncharacterized protein YibQ
VRLRSDKINWKGLRGDKQLKIGIGLAVVLVLFLVFLADIFFSVYKFRNYVEERPKAAPSVAGVREAALREVKVAVILDDAGGSVPDYDELFSIKVPMTVSVLPFLPTSAGVAKALEDAGFEVMLHLPMEPVNGNYMKRGGGMVACSEDDGGIRKIVLDDLASVKRAVGVNNHMGSKATADERVMKAVLMVIKEKGLYFVDSRTSRRSVGFKLAKSFGVPCAENNMFLDGGTSEAIIESNFRRLVSAAKRRGSAIGIGHATRPATIAVLKKLMPEYERKGVKFVYASELAK